MYGITGTHNNVSSSVLDAVYTITNGNMLMQAPINMNRKTIKNLLFQPQRHKPLQRHTLTVPEFPFYNMLQRLSLKLT